ncbi:MAG: carbohydrate ABC transporter substrate-binding protein [Methylobacteriaceae bacterium]|nr:carbohydrate ABC transporter substrate-binding protein [Methylobacteriaceae bacterium]MBV9218998.1 carbohydrate ABC transporter substrate-binding protein [Methylobacteriaceae bacterium]MBV9247581.1 carbohydrate ABC transporter substrate-binding protein [Methylobacteriaceae bacterium]MBV9633906.1 carbohydrate ABC transporter substrate-binding protein [Methylobacteriaceae bacterium]
MKLLAGVVLAAAAGFAGAAQAQVKEVQMVHWWTSGGEAAALNVLKSNLAKEGYAWKDVPIAGGGGNQAMTALRAMVTAGNVPTSVQMLGYDITDWAEQGVLADLSPVATKEGWDKVIPAALQKFAKYDGKWVAAPVNVHSVNWIWVNKAVLDKIGGKEPTNWDEFIALLDKAKAAGVIPLAQGGQNWQEATMFDSVVVTTGGLDFYRKAFIDLDPAALSSPTMKLSFERLAKLRTYVDPSFSGRDWNLATAMVIKGDALLQVMGDWAKGEFINAKKAPGTDFMCFRFPGTQGNVVFNSDMFAMFKVGAERQEAQYALASATVDPGFQSSFNVVKGSVPARTDVSDAAFDACGKKGIADLKEAVAKNTLEGSMAQGYGQKAPFRAAYQEVVDKFFNGQIATADDAVKQLVDAINAAK